MAAAKQPANTPIVEYDGRTMPMPWIAFFDSISARLALLDGLAASTSYANDAAAAAGGVAVGSYYRNGSVVMVRVV